MAKYRGTGKIAATDYKAVKWVGKSKDGKPVTIELAKAINLGNVEWTFAEKNDVVAQVTFTAVYSNKDSMTDDTTEPWTVEVGGQTSGSAEIMLGAGAFFIGENAIALTRGGGNFKVEREYREINADGDRGPVEDRIVMEGSRATLTLNTLQILTKLTDLYPAIETVQ